MSNIVEKCGIQQLGSHDNKLLIDSCSERHHLTGFSSRVEDLDNVTVNEMDRQILSTVIRTFSLCSFLLTMQCSTAYALIT